MRFKEYLNEMTIRAGNLRKGIEPMRKRYEPQIIESGKYIGDLKNLDKIYKIYKSTLDSEVQFALYDDKNLVTLFNGKYKKFKGIDRGYYLDQMITLSDYAGQHLSAKLLVFLKTREKIPVVFSGIHSNDTVHNLRKIAKTIPALQVQWFNINSGEKEEFNPDTDEADTKHAKPYPMTQWRIIIEQMNNDWYNDDNKNKYCNHFISEKKLGTDGFFWDPTEDYNMWDMTFGSKTLTTEVYLKGL